MPTTMKECRRMHKKLFANSEKYIPFRPWLRSMRGMIEDTSPKMEKILN